MPRRRSAIPKLVPIDGERVAAAMRFANFTSRGLAQRLRERGVLPAPLAKTLKRPSASTIDWVLKGTTKRVHRELRDAIAIVCGPPITSEYLGGERSLAVAQLRWPPTATAWRGIPMPFDMIGRDRARRETELLPPGYELTAHVLGKQMTDALKQEGRSERTPWPDFANVIRWYLSVVFWREFLFDGQRHGQSRSDLKNDADLFAHHLAEATRALLRPWLEGKVTTRRNLIRRVAFALDQVAAINEGIAEARQSGREADLAIDDELNGQVGSTSTQLAELRYLLERDRDTDRQNGVSEGEIARRIREGVEGGYPPL
jgi:hypothetical protein